jgi:regulatory protein
MKKVTARKTGRGYSKQVFLLVEGEEIIAGKPVTIADIPASREKAPAENGTDKRCFNAAVRFLRYRPRSEREVRERLRHHGYDSEEIEATIASLKEKKLIDDVAFARFWADNRESFSPRGQRLMKMELRQKGIDGDIIQETVSGEDDSDGAYRAAVVKARSLPRTDYGSFERRLGDFLRRRGFGYGVIKPVIQRVWEEKS